MNIGKSGELCNVGRRLGSAGIYQYISIYVHIYI